MNICNFDKVAPHFNVTSMYVELKGTVQSTLTGLVVEEVDAVDSVDALKPQILFWMIGVCIFLSVFGVIFVSVSLCVQTDQKKKQYSLVLN